jgi:hypothetical protein
VIGKEQKMLRLISIFCVERQYSFMLWELRVFQIEDITHMYAEVERVLSEQETKIKLMNIFHSVVRLNDNSIVFLF